MTNTITHTYADAIEIAKINNEGEEDGWTYEVAPINETFAVVNCYDEEGYFVGAI